MQSALNEVGYNGGGASGVSIDLGGNGLNGLRGELHIFVAVLDGDLREGDAGGGAVAGREHAGEV